MENTKDQKSNKGIIIGGIVLLLIAIFFGWKWISTQSEISQIKKIADEEKAILRHELDSLMAEHERIKSAYGELADSLKVKDSIIQASALEIKKLLDTKWEYVKVSRKLDQLRVVAQSYLRQMDSLYTVNQQLQEENLQMKEEIKAEQQKSRQLVEEKELLSSKIKEGSALSISSLTAETLRSRSGGKEEFTDKGKRIDKIRVCFIIAENRIAQPGTRTFYIRIADPNGNILTRSRGDEYSFTYQGEQLQYSAMANVDYQNKAVKMCADYNKLPLQEKFITGTYQVAVYHEDNLLGETSFTVK